MNIQKTNPVSFKGNIVLKERTKDSLFIGDYYSDDKKIINEIEEIGHLSYGKNYKNKYNCYYLKDIVLNTANIKKMDKHYDGTDYFSTILYFLPKSKQNIDIVLFGDHDCHDKLVTAYQRAKKSPSVNVVV